jgi:DNA-binding transcriptional MerR regulator
MQVQEEFLIQDLAERAGVSHRTIRYYTQEGLLPEPVNRGKYAYYNQEHLDRLLLILHLKDTYLPLKEIRQLLASLSWPEVQDLLKNKALTDQANEIRQKDEAQYLIAEPNSALDYINKLLNTQQAPGASEPARSALNRPSSQPKIPELFSTTPPESWRHFVLAPGVELHIKDPSSSAHRQQIEEIIQFAKRIFQNNQK